LFGRIFATQTGAHFAGKCSREAVKLPSPKRGLTAAEILDTAPVQQKPFTSVYCSKRIFDRDEDRLGIAA
jgi:hypothetical protein